MAEALTLQQRISDAMRERRRELIARPLARIWDELAATATALAMEHCAATADRQADEWGTHQEESLSGRSYQDGCRDVADQIRAEAKGE